ncbi:MAG: CdaR family protein [Solirubrobacteraceae bacterium]
MALAVSLWMVVSGEETVERGLRVPLELQQFPAGLELQGEPPTSVDVRVRGSSGALGRLSASDLVAEVDLRGARPGRRLFHLTPEQVRAPFGVDVVQVNPATIAMAFENSATRQLPVAPSIQGKPAPGYVLGKVVIVPATVEVVGPESAVKRATDAFTEPVSVDGARAPVRETATIGFLDATLRLKGTPTAVVTVQVMPAPVERTMKGVPVHLRGLGAGLTAEAQPSVADVNLRGSQNAIVGLVPDDVQAYVELAGLGAGRYTLTVRADVSGDTGVMRLEPATVQVRITSGRH